AIVPDQAPGQAGVGNILPVYPGLVAVENGQVRHVEPPAVLEHYPGLGLPHPRHVQPAYRAVGAVAEGHRVRRPVLLPPVPRLAVEVVPPDLHVRAVLDQQVVFDAGPERVPGDDHPAGVVEVDVHVRVADDVSGDRDVPVALFVGPLEGRGRPLHADVRRARHTPGVLDRVPGDRHLGVRATGAVDQHIGGWRLVLAVVRLDVAPAHLEVAHLAAEAHDP